VTETRRKLKKKGEKECKIVREAREAREDRSIVSEIEFDDWAINHSIISSLNIQDMEQEKSIILSSLP
jgi:hypothetical protein